MVPVIALALTGCVEFWSMANDWDNDGYTVAQGDCADVDPAIHPGVEEVWYDGVDQNCDGNDNDQDGDGVSVDSDCDDQDPDVQTGCPEDTGTEGEGASAKTGSCGCSTGVGSGGAAWLFVLAGGLIRRRRRTVS